MFRTLIAIAGLCLLAVKLAGPAAGQPAQDRGACAQITAACQLAGFKLGGVGTGTGLLADCVAPIMQGTVQPPGASMPLPQIDPRLVAACKAINPNFGQGGPPGSAAGATIKIMPLGDSITYGTPNPGYGGFRRVLGMLLAKDGYTIQFVGSQHNGNEAVPDPNNEGHPGWTTAQIKHGIDANGWLETADPDIVLLHIGTNDIRLGGATLAPANLSALLDDILARAPRARVLVAQIIPARRGADAVHATYNEAVQRIVASKGPRAALVDMRKVLSPTDYADALHPNPGGYDKMARAWETALRPILAGR
jgi:lysophospholipase L1-like esterase